MADRSQDPVSGEKPVVRPAGEQPPSAPRELDHSADANGRCHRFTADAVEWLAMPAGKGAGGTGSYGLAMMEAVHFFLATDPATPVREALLPAGRFAGLFDDELRRLLGRATPIVTPEEALEVQQARGRRSRRRD